MSHKLNKFSSRITEPKSQGASQAMLYATGLQPAQMQFPQIGIVSMWWEGNPCNMHLRELSDEVKKTMLDEKLIGYQFNTIGVSDGISMGTEGMSYSLQSRDLIADSIETVVRAQWYDGIIALPGCDKNMPGCVMAMARVNRPSIMIYGGTIRAGCAHGKKLDIVSAFQAYGQFLSGDIDETSREEIIRCSIPGAGACGGMYTANTMASAIEALGLSLPFSSSYPAESVEKRSECHGAAQAMRHLLEIDLKPRDILTKAAFHNAMVVVTALGGSTNAVLHLIAIARAAEIELSLEDFQKISDTTPLLADLKPSGKYVMEELHAIGGVPAVMKMLLREGLLHGDCMTVTGHTVAENLAQVADLPDGQEIVFPLTNPIKSSGHIQILHGNLAPGGAVAKITGKEGVRFSGRANVFDSEEEMLAALEQSEIKKGDVVVIRYEGPKGGPGMPEMLTPTSAIMGAGLGEHVAMLTDGRFSGGSHGFIVGHITPEAQEGGPIALVETGDTITIDTENNELRVDVAPETLEARRAAWTMPEYKARRGTLFKYIKNVRSASEGCVTDE